MKKLLLLTLCLSSSASQQLNADVFKTISRYMGIREQAQQQPEQTPATIGVVEIRGSISGAQPHINTLLQAAQTPGLRALVLVIDSGGGLAGASENIAREVAKIRETIPVIVWIENTCCSGAYLIASAASTIMAPKMAHCGSIGTYSTHLKTFPESFKDGGLKGDVEIYPAYAGDHKPHPNMAVTEEQLAHIQERSNSIYRSFYEQVASFRNLSTDNLREWADGKSFDGVQALELGLIDSIGCYSDAITLARGFTTRRGARNETFVIHNFTGDSDHTEEPSPRTFDFYL